MSMRLCHWVPAFLFAGVVAGCSCGETHLRDDAGLGADTGGPSDYLCECCPGVTRLAASAAGCPAACAGLCEGADGGGIVPDAGSSCGPRAAEVVCFDHVSAGREGHLEVLFDPAGEGCFCDQAITCEEERVGASTVLGLQTALCPELPICFACGPSPVASCTIALRGEGSTRVRINGEDAFDLNVAPADVMPERADVCVRTAQVDSCGAIWAPETLSSDRACHLDAVSTGTRVPIRVEDACGGCEQIGPCTVVVLDDLITVTPTRMPNTCEIACPPVCAHTEHLCVTPPLADGVYTVLVRGLTVTDDGPPSTITVGADGPAAVEVCRGSRT
jgi:hypothetical protein